MRKPTEMLILGLITGAVLSGSASAAWYNAAWPYRQEIMIDSNQVSGTLTDFPLLLTEACLQADLVPEVNTSTMRGGSPAEPMPGPDTIRRYAALGGTAMTLGSDAHLADVVAANLTGAADMLQAAGVSHQAVFRARQAELLPLGI